ncbi:DJ-1/PfpI family protein [Pseudomonas sp. NPDC089758]|uniref:DJ-1/PfpI family protein n=1 Tax=Pseudomonas sp. NPDC089758 TaxID=3364473 RepID=UPI003827056F
MNDFINRISSRSARHLSIALIALDGFDFSSLSATMEAISAAKKKFDTDTISCTTIGMRSSPMSNLGISVTPDITLNNARLSEYDVTILIGGSETKLKTNIELTQQLIRAAKAGRLLGGIWNGAYHLAAAGLTDSYECLITGDGKFSIEPPTPNRRRYLSWQFDEYRMTCSDAASAIFMLNAMFDHFFATSSQAQARQESENLRKKPGRHTF